MGSVTLTVVGDELEAELLCGLLRANGIDGWYRKTNMAAAQPAFTIGMAGSTEVLVDETALEAARKLLPAG